VMTTRREAVASKRSVRIDGQGVGFLLLGLAFGAVLIAGSTAVYRVQEGVSALASLVPLGYAFGAGMVATVNPCGVVLLPSLVAYYLGRGEGQPSTARQRATRGLLMGVMATLGFVALFAGVGLVIGAGGRVLADAFPLGGLLVGVALALVGAWLTLTGRGLGILAAGQALGYVRLGSDLRSLFLFGVGYAVASLACTLPVFLVVAASALSAGGPLAATGRFVSYALGMGTVLTAVIIAAAFFQGAVARWLRGVVPYIHRLAASFLVGAGLFVVHYWLTVGGLLG
jgi:cytochrome c-type biogenesis protein